MVNLLANLQKYIYYTIYLDKFTYWKQPATFFNSENGFKTFKILFKTLNTSCYICQYIKYAAPFLRTYNIFHLEAEKYNMQTSGNDISAGGWGMFLLTGNEVRAVPCLPGIPLRWTNKPLSLASLNKNYKVMFCTDKIQETSGFEQLHWSFICCKCLLLLNMNEKQLLQKGNGIKEQMAA